MSKPDLIVMAAGIGSRYGGHAHCRLGVDCRRRRFGFDHCRASRFRLDRRGCNRRRGGIGRAQSGPNLQAGAVVERPLGIEELDPVAVLDAAAPGLVLAGGSVALLGLETGPLLVGVERQQVAGELLNGKLIERQIGIEGMDHPVSPHPLLAL